MSINITKFLQKHNFIVNVIIDQHVVEASYADKFKVYYRNVKNYEGLALLEVKYGCGKEAVIPLNAYAVRLFIVLDIIRICKQNNIPHAIIRYFDLGGKEGGFEDLFEIDLNDREQALEKLLSSYISKYMTTKTIDEKELLDKDLLYTFINLKGLVE